MSTASLPTSAHTRLNAKHEKFCRLILQGQSQSDAYRAVFDTTRYKHAQTVAVQASQLAGRDNIRLRLAEMTAELQRASQMTVERWHQELQRIALGDVRKLFDSNGSLLPLHELGDDEAPLIAGVEHTKLFGGIGEDRAEIGITTKIKMADKLRALELAGKARGFYVEKNKVDLTLTVEHLVTLMNQHAPKVINAVKE